MNLEQVNDSLFCKVYQVNNLYIAKILDRKTNGIPYGEPDVKLVSLTGETQMVTRKELMERYRTLGGKKIKMRGFKNERGYCILGTEHAEQYALKVPMDKTVEYGFNTKVAKPGSWLICGDDGCGGINKQIAVCMSSEQFKKIFKVTKINFEEEYNNFDKEERTSIELPRTKTRDSEAFNLFEEESLWQVVARVNVDDEVRYRVLHENGEEKTVNESLLKKMVRNGDIKEMYYNEGANSYIGWNKLKELPLEN